MPALGLKMRIDRLTSLIASVYQTGLQMWHKFTATTWDGSTDRLPDSSPVGTNTAALYTGRGLSFDGVNDVVTVGATGTTVKTVVFYAYPDSDTTAFMQLQSTGAVRVEISSGTLSATGFTSPTLYVNGAASSTVAATTWQQIAVTSATGVSASNVLLGQSNTTYYGGDLSNVKFFSVELTAGQIAELYANPEQALPTGVSAGDLVGWWPMATNNATLSCVIDGSPNNIGGATSGATHILASPSPLPQWGLKGSYAPMIFDGTNDYISGVKGTSVFSPFTVSCWFLTSDVSTFKNIVSFGASTTDRGCINMSGGFCRVLIGSTDTATVFISGNIVANKLNHVVATFDGVDYAFYINGAAQVGISTTSLSSISTPVIGARSNFSTPFVGAILSYSLWNAALSAGEISNLYAKESPLTVNSDNLLAHYQNTGISNSDWENLVDGTANGTVNGSPTTFFQIEGITAGKDLTGFTLPAINSGELIVRGNGYALATDAATLDITTDITLEAWVKPFTVASLQSAIGKNSAYALNITAGAKLQFQRWSSTASGTVSSTASLTADTWYHIAATYDGTTTKLYINGTEDTSSGAVTGAIDSTATDVLLGALTTSTNLFSGYLDSVKVYDEVLTAAQIKQNYNAEKGSHSNS